MIKLNTPIELDIRAFFRWWLAELSAMVPVWLRKMVTESYDYLLITCRGENFHLSLVTEDPSKEFGGILLNEEGREVWYRLVSRNPEMEETPIVFRLQAGQALVKVVTLPLLAESNLYQVVGFEMERLTPFKLDQVYYDARPVDKLVGMNQIKVELVLIPRKNLDNLLEKMAELRLHPGRVDVASCEEPTRKAPKLQYNLLPQKLHDKPDNRKRAIRALLWLLSAALLVSAGAMPLWMKRAYVMELEAEVKRQNKTASEVQTLKQKADALLRESDFLLRKKTSRPVMVEILNELSTRLPDDTWLEYISYSSPKLQIHGKSPAASALIEVLEAAPIFKGTSFFSQVSQDPTTGLERFQITTLVAQGAEHEQESE